MLPSKNEKLATVNVGYSARRVLTWQKSLHQLIWKPMLAYLLIYLAIGILFAQLERTNNPHALVFCEGLHRFCVNLRIAYEEFPISFILGLYIGYVYSRWWRVLEHIPFCDSMALLSSAFIIPRKSHSLEAELTRISAIKNNINRYLAVSALMTFQRVAKPVKKRWRDEKALVDDGFLTQAEFELFQGLQAAAYPCYNVPLAWATELLRTAREAGHIVQPAAYEALVEEVAAFGRKTDYTFHTNWISWPLVFYQVAAIMIYTHMLLTLFTSQPFAASGRHDDLHAANGNQTAAAAAPTSHAFDYLLPIHPLTKVTLLFGWFKISEALYDPFGIQSSDLNIVDFLRRNCVTGDLYAESTPLAVPLIRETLDGMPREAQNPYLVDVVGLRTDPLFQELLQRRNLKPEAQRPVIFGSLAAMDAQQ